MTPRPESEVERMCEEFLRAHSTLFVKGEWGRICGSLMAPNIPVGKRVVVAIIELEGP